MEVDGEFDTANHRTNEKPDFVLLWDMKRIHFHYKPLSYWTQIYPAFANSVDPDQLASEEANWSGSALFAIKCVNL